MFQAPGFAVECNERALYNATWKDAPKGRFRLPTSLSFQMFPVLFDSASPDLTDRRLLERGKGSTGSLSLISFAQTKTIQPPIAHRSVPHLSFPARLVARKENVSMRTMHIAPDLINSLGNSMFVGVKLCCLQMLAKTEPLHAAEVVPENHFNKDLGIYTTKR